jgi:phosphonate utilization transcriptional regulator
MNKRLPEASAALRLVRSQSLPALVQQELERMILNGELPPGSQLTEIPLATRLGVSRGPVREAFRGLEEQGLVRVEKNRGVFVRSISADEADDIYEVRLALEELLLLRIATAPACLRDSGIEALLAESAERAAAGDVARCHQLNMAFHDRLAVLAGNDVLLDTYRRLANGLSLFRQQAHARITDASSLHASVDDHRAIFAALAAGRGDEAGRLMRRHLEGSRQRLQSLLHPPSQCDTPPRNDLPALRRSR